MSLAWLIRGVTTGSARKHVKFLMVNRRANWLRSPMVQIASLMRVLCLRLTLTPYLFQGVIYFNIPERITCHVEIGCTISKGVRGQSSLTGRTKTAYVTWTSITSVSVTIGDDDEDYFQGEWSPTRGGTLTCESPSATAAVASGESVTYQWELVSGSVGFAGGSLESLVSTSYGVEPSEAVKQSSLTLAPNTLLAGSEYTFKCTVILEALGTTGEASQTITVNTAFWRLLEVRYNEMTSTILCPSTSMVANVEKILIVRTCC